MYLLSNVIATTYILLLTPSIKIKS